MKKYLLRYSGGRLELPQEFAGDLNADEGQEFVATIVAKTLFIQPAHFDMDLDDKALETLSREGVLIGSIGSLSF